MKREENDPEKMWQDMCRFFKTAGKMAETFEREFPNEFECGKGISTACDLLGYVEACFEDPETFVDEIERDAPKYEFAILGLLKIAITVARARRSEKLKLTGWE